jgi:hypothetical protein
MGESRYMTLLTKLTAAIVAFSLIALVIPCAEAGPPYVADDPEPVDYQHWEFYVASMHSKYGGDWSGTAPHFELNYGAVPNLQLHLIAPLAYDVPPQGASHYGIGDVELGAKFRFIQETNGWPMAGIFPLLEVPAGSLRNNLGNGHAQVFAPLWLQKSWDSWTAYGGGGYGINSLSGHDNWGFVGALLQDQVRKNVSVGLEIYHQTLYQTDFPNQGTAFNFGTVIDFSDFHHLLFSAGRCIDGPIHFQCYIAYQYTFDNSLFKFLNSPPRGGSR